jgi:hypothetical protein
LKESKSRSVIRQVAAPVPAAGCALVRRPAAAHFGKIVLTLA